LVHPLGLAGYALFLVFGLLARATRRDERRWILPVALAAAGIALFGGIGLAYQDVDHAAHQKSAAQPTPSPTPAQIQQDVRHVIQTSKGDCNPNVISTGTVTVNCPELKKQSSPKAKPPVGFQ
jgi:disulfide bond formation protein DsbB